MTQKSITFLFSAGLLCTALLTSENLLAAESVMSGPPIGEPQYNVTDGNSVNVASAMAQFSLQDIAIGSNELLLSHSISINSQELANLDSYIRGYKDKFRGGIRGRYQTQESNPIRIFKTVYVADHEISEDFYITDEGTFEPMADKRLQLLVEDSHHFTLIKPSGEKVVFYSRSVIPEQIDKSYVPYASMTDIIYPNGFSITVHKDGNNIGSKITSVNTNNGLQLKYVYDIHNRPLDSSKRAATSNPEILADSLNWSNEFPKKIIALNNAIETCPISGNTCNTSYDWPTVTYEWPDGMPRALYIGKSVFSVTDYHGIKTEFHHTAIDEQDGAPYPINPGTKFFPRITRVKNNKGRDISYEYENVWNGSYITPFMNYSSVEKGVLVRAIQNGIVTNYNFRNGGIAVDGVVGGEQSYGVQVWTTGGYKPVISVSRPRNIYFYGTARLSAPYRVETWDQVVHLNADFANKIDRTENKLNGVETNYTYDEFGRLTQIESDGVYTTIGYPYSYTGFCDNYRYCHKASKISKKHLASEQVIYTYYTYHSSSGNIASIRYPANSQNKILKKVYSYKQYYARYYNSDGIMENGSTPIWLLDEEFLCQNSNVSGNACLANDKVKTNYIYAQNNLFPIGKIVTSEKDNKSLTYCFQYDRYGNKIEESTPKSGVANCNVVSEIK